MKKKFYCLPSSFIDKYMQGAPKEDIEHCNKLIYAVFENELEFLRCVGKHKSTVLYDGKTISRDLDRFLCGNVLPVVEKTYHVESVRHEEQIVDEIMDDLLQYYRERSDEINSIGRIHTDGRGKLRITLDLQLQSEESDEDGELVEANFNVVVLD